MTFVLDHCIKYYMKLITSNFFDSIVWHNFVYLFLLFRLNMKIFAILSILLGVAFCNEYYTLSTKQGTLKGKIMESRNNKKFIAFQNIPFAKPPIGELRFEVSMIVIYELFWDKLRFFNKLDKLDTFLVFTRRFRSFRSLTKKKTIINVKKNLTENFLEKKCLQ